MYLLLAICAFFSFGIYMFAFRLGVTDYLRYHRHSRRFIKKNKKGCVNYWFYQKLHEAGCMGYVYYLNLALLVLTALYIVCALGLGYLDVMVKPVAVLGLLLGAVQIPASIFVSVYEKRVRYGQSFIVFRWDKAARGGDSSIIDITAAFVTPALASLVFVLAFFGNAG